MSLPLYDHRSHDQRGPLLPFLAGALVTAPFWLLSSKNQNQPYYPYYPYPPVVQPYPPYPYPDIYPQPYPQPYPVPYPMPYPMMGQTSK